MKKSLITHFSFLTAFIVLVALFKGWFSLDYLPFLYGGIIGILLPYSDYLIHIYLMKPQADNSRIASSLMNNGNYKQTFNVLVSTRHDLTDLIFHAAYFQLFFLVFSFLVVSSSGSLLGRGLVLAFLLHLLVDQLVDMVETKSLDFWFRKILVITDREQRRWYLVVNLVGFLILSFVF